MQHHFSVFVRRSIAAVLLTVAIPSLPALAIVAHNSDVPSNKPANAVVGRWGDNGSCVVISPSFVITTRHQGVAPGTTVTVNGQSYTVAEVTSHALADLCVARLSTTSGGLAVLTSYVGLYNIKTEFQQTFVLGGYGKAVGETKYAQNGLPYAYTWAGASNDTLRWGDNYVDRYANIPGLFPSTAGLVADFDAPGQGGAVAYEAVPAEWDSGGGWFLQANGVWKVAGLSASVEHAGESWFAEPIFGGPDPDTFYAVRISSYASWIDGVVKAFHVPGDANRDLYVNMTDLSVLSSHWGQAGTWTEGDFDGNGDVSFGDLAILAGFWGYGANQQGDGAPVPEPVSGSLLGLAALALLKRRRA